MASARQLAAIMFTDIAGYTALMEKDEATALEYRDKFQKKLEKEVARHEGRLLELRGDGALCSFSSTLEAVRTALEVQLEMRNSPVVPLRIGIHTGDIIAEDNAVYGDGVNIASRIESFAIPGSIFISGKVYDDIKNQKEIQTLSLGKFSLKNVREPIDIYAVSNPGIVVPDNKLLEGKGERLNQRCILVLPFINMSNDTEKEYFSDGLTEELISNLSRLKDIKVISRTTSMKYKGTNKDVKTIGNETEAGFIVEGSVRMQNNNLRITAQFVDAKRDLHLWTETYRGTMDDIFDIQENVSGKIVDALRMQLTHDERDHFRKRYTDNSEAYHYYLQGRFSWNKRNEKGLKAAMHQFEKALEIDPDYALAWAGLADTYSLMADYANVQRKEVYPKIMSAINKALTIDNQLAEAHISNAINLMLHEWDWKTAEKEFLLGIGLSPSYATGHHWYSEYLLFMGRFNESHREISLAVELDPVSPGILKDKGINYYYSREFEKGIEMGKKTLELDPQFASAFRLLSLCYQQLGMVEKAIRENERWGKAVRDDIKTAIGKAYILAAADRKEEGITILNGVLAQGPARQADMRNIALIYVAAGDAEKAFEWLEKCYELHDESFCILQVDPKMDPIRNDPRFDVLARKIGLKN